MVANTLRSGQSRWVALMSERQECLTNKVFGFAPGKIDRVNPPYKSCFTALG